MKKIIKIIAIFSIVFLSTHYANAEIYNNDLTIGSNGVEVESLQTFLESNGYLVMPAGISKGYFGQITRSALAEYQKTIGFPAYGFFGPMTRDHFNKGKGNIKSLNIISPNGGETWQKGTTQTIRWNSPQYFKATNFDISIMAYCEPGLLCGYRPRDIAKNVGNANGYSWVVGNVTNEDNYGTTIPDGKYTISVCESGTSVCTTSKKPFTITSQVVDSRVPVINSFNAPTTLIVGQTGTWTVNATDPQNSSLSYYVSWEDVISALTNGVSQSSPTFTQSTSFTHSYSNPGTYTVRVTVRNSAGLTTSSSATVQVTSNGQTSGVKVISPNGGENWLANSVHQIMWTNTNAAYDSKVDLYLTPVVACPLIYPAPASCYPKDIVLDKNINSNAIYNWIVGTDIVNNKIPSGTYTVKVCKAGTTDCDLSDGSFNVN